MSWKKTRAGANQVAMMTGTDSTMTSRPASMTPPSAMPKPPTRPLTPAPSRPVMNRLRPAPSPAAPPAGAPPLAPRGPWLPLPVLPKPLSPPVLAVRLQELFGLAETPRIAGGRQPVKLHLLSPARRPVQVTQDLANFWRSTYAEVKKDLKGRYPKHHWPDDPLIAEPTARAKPRK